MILSVTAETESLERSLREYVKLAGKTIEETLEKQGAKFASMLSAELRGIAPKKGGIRSARTKALEVGTGLRIRERVVRKVYLKYGVSTRVKDRRLGIGKKASVTTGKGLNLQNLLVKAELSTRESGIGFLSVSSRYPRVIRPGTTSAKSKFGPSLSQANLKLSGPDGSLTFTWGDSGELSQSAARGLSREQAEKKIATALSKTTEDILVYIARKNEENAKKAGLS
jgi:hypothetical protein